MKAKLSQKIRDFGFFIAYIPVAIEDASSSYGARILTTLEQNIFPWIGKLQITGVTPPELLSALRRVVN